MVDSEIFKSNRDVLDEAIVQAVSAFAINCKVTLKSIHMDIELCTPGTNECGVLHLCGQIEPSIDPSKLN